MKNYEKYADEMKKLHGAEWCDVIAKPNALKSLGIKCENISCSQCGVMTTLQSTKVEWCMCGIMEKQVGLHLITNVLHLGNTPNWQKVRMSNGEE